MKKIAVILAVVLLAGCTSSTEFGACVGAFDNKKPDLEYKVSAWNLAMGIIFFELILPPIFVVVDEFHCPVAKK